MLRFLFCVSLLLVSLNAWAEESAKESPKEPVFLPASSLTVEVKTLAAKKAINEDVKNRRKAIDRTHVATRSVDISVRNTSQKPVGAVMTAYWIGKTAALKNKTREIITRKTFNLDLLPGATVKETFETGDVTRTDKSFDFEDHEEDGVRIEGWVLMFTDKTSGKLIAVKASEQALDILARTPGAIDDIPDSR